MKLSEKFICQTEVFATIEKPVSAPCFKRIFSLKNVENTEITVCGLGFYKIFLNGKQFTKGYFAPYISNTDHVVYYDSYRVDEYLQTGENVLTVILGNGMQNAIGGNVFGMDKGAWRSAPKLALCLEQNGETLLEADEAFWVTNSPIDFDDMRIGEHYDARKQTDEFFNAQISAMWKKAQLTQPPRGEKRLCNAQPIRAYKEIKAKKIIPYENGYIYDFGINSAGICRLHIDATAGQKVSMYHFEVFSNGQINKTNIALGFGKLIKDGFWQQNEYICKDGHNVYEPSFAWVGCRYVYVRGITKAQATKNLLTYVLLSSSADRHVEFTCSNKKLNALYQNIINSNLSNFYYFPMDCPQREKNGWSGDAMLSAEQYCLQFNCLPSLHEWLFNFQKAQRENGQLPLVVPCGENAFQGDKVMPAWDGAAIEIPYRLYQYYRDKTSITENMPMMLKYLHLVSEKRQENGLIACGMGDREETFLDESSDHNTPIHITDTLTAIDLCNKVLQMLAVIEDKENMTFVQELCDSLLQAFRKNCINEYCKVVPFTQTGQALAIDVGIFEEKHLAYAVQQLVWLIQADGYKIRAGVLGMRRIFNVLSRYGYTDLAYRMAMSEEYPGFLYYVNHGATSLWESSIKLTCEKNSRTRVIGERLPSLNHHWMSNVASWLIKYVVGINLLEDFSAVKGELCPTFVDGLRFIKCKAYVCGEEIHLLWKKRGNRIILRCKRGGNSFSLSLSKDNTILNEKTLHDGTKVYTIKAERKTEQKQVFFPIAWELRQ